MYLLFRRRALGWQLLLVSVEFGLLLGSVRMGGALRYWGHADIQVAFDAALRWRAPLVAVVLILAMAACLQVMS